MMEQGSNEWEESIKMKDCVNAITYFDVELQIFIHRVNVVKDVLYYSGNNSHCICVMKISLENNHNTSVIKVE